MKLLNITVRNILIIGIIIALAAAMMWLAKNQVSSPLTVKSNTAASLVTSTLTFNSPTPTITDTPLLPTPDGLWTTATPLFNADTPIPGPTYTPTPLVVQAAAVPKAVKIIDNQLLSLSQLRSLSSQATEDIPSYALFDAAGWTTKGEIILQERELIKLGDVYYPETLYRVTNTWAVSPNDGKVTSLPKWVPSSPITIMGGIIGPTTSPIWVMYGYNNEGNTTIDWMTIPTWTPIQRQLASQWAAKKPVEFPKPQYWHASPDGETVILHIVTDKIYIFKPTWSEPVVLPKDKGSLKCYDSAADVKISPDGQRVAYGVRVDNPEVNDGNGREADTYEIQISNLDGSNIVVINLAYKFSNPGGITWSSDNQFIAFTAQPEEYSDGHVYIAKSDGSAVTDVTPSDFKLATSLYWSLDGLELLYTGGNPNKPETIGYWIMSLARP